MTSLFFILCLGCSMCIDAVSLSLLHSIYKYVSLPGVCHSFFYVPFPRQFRCIPSLRAFSSSLSSFFTFHSSFLFIYSLMSLLHLWIFQLNNSWSKAKVTTWKYGESSRRLDDDRRKGMRETRLNCIFSTLFSFFCGYHVRQRKCCIILSSYIPENNEEDTIMCYFSWCITFHSTSQFFRYLLFSFFLLFSR